MSDVNIKRKKIKIKIYSVIILYKSTDPTFLSAQKHIPAANINVRLWKRFKRRPWIQPTSDCSSSPYWVSRLPQSFYILPG